LDENVNTKSEISYFLKLINYGELIMNLPKITQKRPYILRSEKKKYTCWLYDLSNNQPFCDGSHWGTGI